MKQLQVALVILGLLVGVGIWTNHLLHRSAEDLAHHIDKIAAEIRDDRWEGAVHRIGELRDSWDEQARWWPVLLNHQEIDNIEFSLGRMKEYVANQDKALSLGQLSELKMMIKHIPAKEAVTLRNIL